MYKVILPASSLSYRICLSTVYGLAFFPDISPISNNLFRYSFTLTGNLVFFLCFLRAYPTFSTNDHHQYSQCQRSDLVDYGIMMNIFPPTFVLFCQQLYHLLPCHINVDQLLDVEVIDFP